MVNTFVKTEENSKSHVSSILKSKELLGILFLALCSERWGGGGGGGNRKNGLGKAVERKRNCLGDDASKKLNIEMGD